VSVRATEYAAKAGAKLELDVAAATAAYSASGSDTPALNVSRNQQTRCSWYLRTGTVHAVIR